ncbi:hypothetical protein SCLCIDRAFT_1215765 [Scleroderma citrinum Foug A]|uniref:Uncharacterized protein n=1 Tax=Scleroderma citrinum Foug A TaxID=1036808 RepID=A0A0C3DZN4_9AGAM|nr:hypothetical protein SCLCIDRAFT_1215765 [Scleroderma citrinum Foug A]
MALIASTHVMMTTDSPSRHVNINGSTDQHQHQHTMTATQLLDSYRPIGSSQNRTTATMQHGVTTAMHAAGGMTTQRPSEDALTDLLATLPMSLMDPIDM